MAIQTVNHIADVSFKDHFLDLDGACVEAKGDNVQEFLARAAGIVKAAKSDETTDLARSIGAELADIAE